MLKNIIFASNYLLMKNILLLIIILFASSCVPYKNIVYIQGQPDSNQTDKKYEVKKNDILYIDIKSSNENIQKIFGSQSNRNSTNMTTQTLYFSGYTVDENGEIEMPVINKLNVEGKTFAEIQKMIKTKLLSAQFTSLEDVFISVKLAGIPYTIVGEVKQPKTGVLYKTNPNIFDVLADAGDITLTGDRRHVFVIRKENGKQTKTSLDLTKANIVNSEFYYIRPNDLIYVQALRQKTLGTGTTLSQTISTTISALSLITSVIIFANFINQNKN